MKQLEEELKLIDDNYRGKPGVDSMGDLINNGTVTPCVMDFKSMKNQDVESAYNRYFTRQIMKIKCPKCKMQTIIRYPNCHDFMCANCDQSIGGC